MPKQSAGILLYHFHESVLKLFLVHPGGPFWKNKDEGAWSVPKGEFTDDEDALDAAKREFEEETGQKISGDFKLLQPVKQKGGKIIYAWAVEGEAGSAARAEPTNRQAPIATIAILNVVLMVNLMPAT